MSQEEKFIGYLREYKNLILKVAGIYCRNPEERKDLVQEIILQLWRAFPKYNGLYALSTWTYRIALNVSISFVRKTSRRNKVIQNYKANTDILYISGDEKVVDERLSLLYDAMEFLKPIDKAIISLYLEEIKNKEISEVLGLSVSNVSTRIARIKQQLKNRINKTK